MANDNGVELEGPGQWEMSASGLTSPTRIPTGWVDEVRLSKITFCHPNTAYRLFLSEVLCRSEFQERACTRVLGAVILERCNSPRARPRVSSADGILSMAICRDRYSIPSTSMQGIVPGSPCACTRTWGPGATLCRRRMAILRPDAAFCHIDPSPVRAATGIRYKVPSTCRPHHVVQEPGRSKFAPTALPTPVLPSMESQGGSATS